MKKRIALCILFVLIVLLGRIGAVVCLAAESEDVFYISAGGKQLKVRLENNQSAAEFKTVLAEGDISVKMSRNGGFEQYGDLGRSFTSGDKRIAAKAGDVILYNSRYLCVFYGSNTYSYTRIGKIQGMSNDELKQLLSKEDFTMTLSLKSFGEVPKTGIADMTARYRIMLLAGVIAVIAAVAVIHRHIVSTLKNALTINKMVPKDEKDTE